MTSAIEVHGLGKHFGDIIALDALDLDVGPAPCSDCSAPTGRRRLPLVRDLRHGIDEFIRSDELDQRLMEGARAPALEGGRALSACARTAQGGRGLDALAEHARGLFLAISAAT